MTNPPMDNKLIEDAIVEFNKTFGYFGGEPMMGSLELTHNNVRDWLRSKLNEVYAQGREEGVLKLESDTLMAFGDGQEFNPEKFKGFCDSARTQ